MDSGITAGVSVAEPEGFSVGGAVGFSVGVSEGVSAGVAEGEAVTGAEVAPELPCVGDAPVSPGDTEGSDVPHSSSVGVRVSKDSPVCAGEDDSSGSGVNVPAVPSAGLFEESV